MPHGASRDRDEDGRFEAGTVGPRPRAGRLQRLMQKAWWLHSFGALAFGAGVMMFARKGLDHADKVLTVLAVSWLLIFVAFRFIVGAANIETPGQRAKLRSTSSASKPPDSGTTFSAIRQTWASE